MMKGKQKPDGDAEVYGSKNLSSQVHLVDKAADSPTSPKALCSEKTLGFMYE